MGLSILVALALGCSRAPKPTPEAYVLPAGYTGWVLVEYDLDDAPPLEVIDGRRQLHVPQSGTLRTSSMLEVGRIDQVFSQGGSPVPFSADLVEPIDTTAVCCLYTGHQTDSRGRRSYQVFYIGLGPATEPPLTQLLAR